MFIISFADVLLLSGDQSQSFNKAVFELPIDRHESDEIQGDDVLGARHLHILFAHFKSIRVLVC